MLVVDTSVLIAHLRGSRAATEILEGRAGHEEIVVPSLVVWELLKGADNDRAREIADRLIADLSVDPLTSGIARLAADLHIDHERRGVQRPAWDLLVAAHALFHGAALATADKGFERVEGLTIVRVASR